MVSRYLRKISPKNIFKTGFQKNIRSMRNTTSTSNHEIKLIENGLLNFELLLLELELKALGLTNFKNYDGKIVFNDLKDYEFKNILQKSSFISFIDDIETDYSKITRKKYKGRNGLFLTHWFYYYKGKFFPRHVRSIINIIGLTKGDKLWDPFLGSGTSALESQLLGLEYYGNDISPISEFVTGVKTKSVYFTDNITKHNTIIKKTLSQNEEILIKSSEFTKLTEELTNNKYEYDFFKLARINTIRSEKNGKNLVDKFNYIVSDMVEFLLFFKDILTQVNSMHGYVHLHTLDTRNKYFPDNYFDGIITSPPYFSAIDYLFNDKIYLGENNFNSQDIRNNFIGLRASDTTAYKRAYINDLFKVAQNTYSSLKKNKYAVFFVGNNFFRKKLINNVEYCIEAMLKAGFYLEFNIPMDLFAKNKSILRENILFFKKL